VLINLCGIESKDYVSRKKVRTVNYNWSVNNIFLKSLWIIFIRHLLLKGKWCFGAGAEMNEGKGREGKGNTPGFEIQKQTIMYNEHIPWKTRKIIYCS
jgi:hypothetical protein